jgi:hypothetical protein
MSTKSYLPYRTLGERLDLSAEVDDGETPTSATGEILAYELEADPLTLRFRLGDWKQDIDDALPEREKEDPPIRVFLAFQSDQSRRRFAVELAGEPCRHSFARAEWRGRVSVQAFVVRSRDSVVKDESAARDTAARLAWSRPVVIHFDEPPRPPGDHLEVVWEDFRTSPDSWRKRHQDNIFALDLLSGERPVIRLNSGLPNLRSVLNNSASHGRAARIRDSTNFMIAHQGWTSLISAAMAAVRDAHEVSNERPLRELLDELVEWEKKVLEDWSRPIFSEHNADESLDKMLTACCDAQGAQSVMARVPNAIQARLNTMRGFVGLVRDSRLFPET